MYCVVNPVLVASTIIFSGFLPSSRLASADTFGHAYYHGYVYVMYLQLGRL